MARMKATILQNFATIGIPDFEEEVSKNWSIVALSEHLIDEERLEGNQHLNTRRLDLVIHNGSKLAFMNLQAFKIFECEVATNTIRDCVTHYLTPNGNLLFGMQPSGDLVVLTEGLQKHKHIKKPSFIKSQPGQSRWYDIPGKIAELLGISKSRINQVNPEATLQSIQITGSRSRSIPPSSLSVSWWETEVTSAISSSGLSENLKSQFPYLTSLLDGLAVLCAFSPTDCYIFLSSYKTALRSKSIANIKGSEVPGEWYRIIMQKGFIAKWLEERREVPFFEARLCYNAGKFGESVVCGAMLYGVMENMRLELVYGIIKRRTNKFTMTWEMPQLEAVGESGGEPCNLGARFVAKLSSDCTKIAIVISNHLGIYVHVQDIPTYTSDPIPLKRQRVSLCNHSDYDGCNFYKKECWISDVQWLVEDAYFAVMTLCGSLSIFHSSGEPMIVKVCKLGSQADEFKLGSFYFPVFHAYQIVSSKEQQRNEQQAPSLTLPSHQRYPSVKWIDSEQVLICSSGKKIELFSIQRVFPITVEEGQREIWLGEGRSNKINTERRHVSFAEIQKSYATASYSSFSTSALQSSISIPEDKSSVEYSNYYNKHNSHQKSSHHHLRYRKNIEEEEENDDEEQNSTVDTNKDDYNDDENVDEYSNDGERSRQTEELPPDGGEVEEEKLDEEEDQNDQISNDIPTPEGTNKSAEILLNPEILILSMPGSMSQLNIEEYSDGGSSEPDFSPDYQKEAPAVLPPLGNYISLPNFSTASVERKMIRKLSQQYMADDEADDDDDRVRGLNNNNNNNRRRRAFLQPPPIAHFANKKQPRSATTMSAEDSDPRSLSLSTSGEHETEFSPETYSPPFSFPPTTTGEDIDEEMDDDDNDEDHLLFEQEAMIKASTAHVSASRSQSSSTTVSLQIPPVPVISGIIVPPSRQSDVLLREMQPELMRYKPPPTTTSPLESCNLEKSCFKSEITGAIGTQEEKMVPVASRKGKVSKLVTFDEEDEEEEEEDEFHECQTTNNINGASANVTSFATPSDSTPVRFRDSSMKQENKKMFHD